MYLCNHFWNYADFWHPRYSAARKFSLNERNIYMCLFRIRLSQWVDDRGEQSLPATCSPASWHQGLQKSLPLIFFHFEMQPSSKYFPVWRLYHNFGHLCHSSFALSWFYYIPFLRWESGLQAIPKTERCVMD